ncbi:hypothetical protein ACIRQP_41825 [Streptomyces sp. NPDC102274]|uniref:hypothetical protein n=1 Tax=Streptomyces sp. NPDC102274 TaxID=3366151 RepID=UPI0038177988
MSQLVTCRTVGEQWYCPTDARWFDETAWETEVESEPGFKQTWHTCPNGHGIPGRTPYASRDSEAKARTADGTPIENRTPGT